MQKKLSKDNLLDISFLILNICVVLSLNSLISIFYGITQGASPLILLSAITIIKTIKVKYTDISKWTLILLFMLYIYFYSIATFTRIFFFSETIYQVSFFGQYSNFLSAILFILAYYLYLSKRLLKDFETKKVFDLIYYPFVCSTLIIIIQTLLGVNNFVINDNFEIDENRAMGVFANPNAAGFVANITILLSICKITTSTIYETIIFIIVLLLSLYASFLTLSKSSIIISIIIIFYSMFFLGLKSKQKKIFFSAIVILTLPIYYLISNFEDVSILIFDETQISRVTAIKKLLFDVEFSNETTSSRYDLFNYGVSKIKENFILGNGLGFFQWFPGNENGVHNTFLLIIGEGGIFAFLLFILFIISTFINSFFLQNDTGLMVSGLIIILILSSMGNHNFFDDKITIILQVIIVAFSLNKKISLKKL